MNYNANVPDWHQYNPSQSGINDVTSTAQNVNSGHFSFISSISPTQLNSLNLSSEGHEKHQTDPNFNSRHFQPHMSANISHGHNAAENAPPLTSMVQMQNCIGHYGPSNTRNPMVDNLNGSMDPRNTALSNLNEELGYRNNQMPVNGPISHLNGPNVMNMNVPHGSIGPRNTNMNSHTANRTGPPSFVSCKGLCCNPDPNINYQQWDKYCTYQNNTAYRENIRSSAYQTDTRRFGNDLNFRKDNFDGKEVSSSIVPNAPTADHRRNFPDFKYRKDRLLSRSYPPATGMLQNYSMQNYNYTAEYQKYPYNVKEYSKMNSMSIPNQGMVKHQELSFIAQQKYNNKQTQYQNNAMMSTSSMPSGNVNPNMIPSAQNTYCFNPQYSRNLSTETSHDQETADNVSMMNRMQTSMTAHAPHPRYQIYQQKIAMQRFSMENHLKEMTRIPGYQSHPKYKECVLRYREILKLQQSVTCQGQIQQTPCVTASTVNTSVPPINLRFDQNGVLINSNYMPEAFPRVQQTLNTQAPIDNSDKQSKQEHNNIPEMTNVHKPEQLVLQQHDSHTTVLCSDSLRKQDRYSIQKDLDQNQFEVQKTSNENFGSVSASDSSTVVQRKISKKFADKPELDVRQFLANWDESEDEDSVSSNMPDIVLTNSTPVVVVGYENVDLSAKTLVDGLDGSKPEEIQSNVVTFQNQDKTNVDTASAQNCLTISYSAAGNVEISKDICKQVPKESIVQPGSIIQCISNGPDEVPTIHIVDNLEISNILRVTGGQVAETLEQQNAMTFFHEKTKVETAGVTLQNDKFKSNDTTYEATEPITEYNADIENLSKKKYIVEKASPLKTVESDHTSQTSQINGQRELPTSSVSTKNNLDSAQDINLKKQSSFTSEESHNPDDISLPDLPTSECTPISTTLNTPIHSDSEESSERVEDLTISTNPIEVVQNSPIISFTQSPMRGEPYDHLNDERTVKNKSEVPLETQYRVEDRFKDDGNNMLNHDTVIGTFEFSTNIDKNESTVSTKDDKEHASPNGNATASNEETSILDSETKNTEVASVCMILTSGEYELKTVSTDMQSKSTQDYKHSTIERHIYESQTVASQDVQVIRKTLQTLSETDAEVPFRYNDTVELDKALENITSNTDSTEHDTGNDNVDNAKVYEERLLKISKKESKPCAISSVNERKCISPELTCQTKVTSISSTSLSTSTITNDITSRNSKLTVENSGLTKTAKNNPPVSRDMKYSVLNNDKLKKNERFANDISAKEIVLAERNANDNRSSKINVKDLKNSRHVNLMDHKKSTSSNSMDLSNKKYLFEDTAEKCNETIIHPDEHSAKEVTTYKIKSNCTAEDLKESNNSKNESKVIDKNVDNNRERLRLLKEYRRMKSNIPGIGQNQNKDKDTQKVSDHEASKGYSLSSLGKESMSQTLSDKELCQDTKSKPSEEQERKHAILKTFVSKNVKPDFAIQVTNVNLKLKDDHQKDLQHIGEEAKKSSSSSLDAIKIEINVSCTERNTTEKLLHENIKNAVAETIGHLTNSISNGARSNSTNLTEIQCDKMITCDKLDSRDYDIYKRSLPSSAETCIYNDACKNQDNAEKEEVRHKSEMIEREESLTNDETPALLISKKRRSSSLERELMNNIREDKGNVNVEFELASGVLEASKPEQIKRRNVHQNAEKRIAATNVCLSIEESMMSENSSYMSSTFRNVGAQKKERQDVFPCKNAKNLQDSVSSRLNAGPSTSSNIANPGSESASYNNFTYFDYNHFDVAPNESVDTDDKRTDRWRRSKRDDGKLSNCDLYETPNGYINPTFFSIDEPKDLNRVPVYITKDGKITYSPNPRFTYRELITEARTKEGHDNMSELYFPSFDYYDCSKLRKVFKRNRNVNSASKKKEIDPVDIKPQFAAGHTNYLSNKNTTHKNIYCTKTRSASHLELFNDADKSYTSKSNQQESKESNKRNVMDLSLLDKPCDADNEPNAKYCKTKIFADNLDHENRYNESFLFDSILFPEPKIPSCWEETMESVKSYSSHIDRRNSDNRKELNFSEIFAVQKRSNSPSFLSEEQNFSNGKCNRKTNNNRNMSNELRLPRTTCSYIDDLCLLQDGDPHCKRLDTVSCNDQEDRNNDTENVVSATGLDNKFANMHNALLRKECEKKQETQFDKTESDALISTERTRFHSPKAIGEKLTKVLEKDQNPTSYIEGKETLTGNIVKDDMHVHCLVSSNKDTCDTADINIEQSSAEVVSLSKTSIDSNNLPDKLKCTEIIMKSSTFVLNEQTNKINDSVKNSSDFTISDEVTYQVSSVLADCKDREKILPTIESDVSHEIYFNEANGRNDTHDKGNFLVCKGKKLIVSQNLPNVALVSQSLDDEKTEPKLKTLENKGQTVGSVSKNRENDEIDNCGSVISKPTVVADLHAIATEEICDIFTNQKHEQNISEFTVIKSIIQSDKKPYPEEEMGKNLKNCDNIIDTKLLCIGSSDCGIYVEDQCVLTNMSEHDFTEDDSRVPMEWETNQIQEDAVNRLCSIDESSIDFAGATNSLRSEDNSLLDNFSLARSVIKESPVLISEMENKSNEPAPVIESKAIMLCNDEDREQDRVSSSGYEKVAYLRATDCNANTRMVPKLVIKKTEVSSKCITKVNSPSVTDNISNKSVLKPNCQPKIPKMIIRNARSRPGTPSIEAVTEKMSAQVNLSDRTLPYMAHNEMREELFENDSESSLQGSVSQNKNKIPKMKIKLDENYSNKIIIAEDTVEHCVKRKNMKKTIPKVKIKNLSGSDLPDNSICNIASSQESKDLGKYEEKIPILKLKKQESNRSSSPEETEYGIRKRQNSSHSEVPFKKCKKLGREETEHSTRHSDSPRAILAECETKKNPLVRISEKIPKVIIKRTSANAEFKCELSKGCKSVIAKSAKWQPEVKLERYRILDSIVKDLKTSSLTPISLQIIDKIFTNRKNNCRQGKKDNYDFHRLSRSNSTSELLPVKCKQRRMSDYDYKRTNGELKDDVNFSPTRIIDSEDTKMSDTKKDKSSRGYNNKSNDEYRKDNKYRSRSRDNNSETDVTVSCDKEINRSIIGRLISTDHEQIMKTDEDLSSISIKLDQKDILVEHSKSTNFKNVLKELKATSKLETCFVKLPSLDEISSTKIDSQTDLRENKDQENDSFSSKDNKIVVKKERLNSCNDNVCTIQDIVSLKDDPANILDNSEDSNSVIKIDSSDESQTTIEILPASPDGNRSESRMIEDGDSEQLYPADAIPTQFELELEITDNSNIDLLDASMPKLDHITCGSRRVSNDENCSDRTPKIAYSNKSESLSLDKNSQRNDECIKIDISGDEKSVSGNKSIGSIEENLWESPCSEKTNPAAIKESFCCNDSLIKEVLAAKETLKKCLSKSGCESNTKNNPRPKTVAEKKQGSSFELNDVSKMRSESSDALKNSCGNVRLATGSIPAADRHKTEIAEKPDKKHSQQNENITVKKKLKSSEKDNKEFCSTHVLNSKETMRVDSKKAKDTTHECTTISLKAFRRFGQAASSGKAIRIINLNEERENITEQNDTAIQLRDIRQREESVMSSCKISSHIPKSMDEKSNVSNNTNGIKSKEDNMPILEPEIAVSFDASSDRDNSRSPPVITNQDSGDIDVAESKLVEDKLVTLDDKVESNLKDIHKRSEMTITDFVTQLAYHEKATIKHRRYCNLCERWFPTTSRHRRHLAGYQHRHLELTQRRSIHALFMLFTGKPCPRLLPANVVRNDCSVGELTPLQIAVQDVTKCFDHVQQSPKKQNDVDK